MCGLSYGPPSLFSAATLFSNPIGVLSACLWVVFAVCGVALLIEMLRERRRMTPEDRVPWRRTLREYAAALEVLGMLSGVALVCLGESLLLALRLWVYDQTLALTVQARLQVACTIDPALVTRQEAAMNQGTITALVLFTVGAVIFYVCAIGPRIPQLRRALRARRAARSGEGG